MRQGDGAGCLLEIGMVTSYDILWKELPTLKELYEMSSGELTS